VLLRQTRVGEHGELFMMYKFRTMHVDAEAPGEAIWATKDDPRVTSVGRFMRRFRLDELPQIWNVLAGDMSIVGPRPERPEFIDQLLESVPFWARRHLVKPGITGWAQVKRGYTSDTKGTLDKLSYDLWYIRHRSLTTDTVICARTLHAIIRGEWNQADVPLPDLDPLLVLLNSASPASQLGAE
jgi:lipopolysaccharide/colanic/teichoic acid biosynthesis glycosyltransferase